MSIQPASPTRPLGRHLLVAPLVVLLLLSAAPTRAQVAPTPAPLLKPMTESFAYFIDSKPTTKAEAEKIDPETILFMDVVKDAAQKKLLGQASADGVMLVTTKANANMLAVVAFNKRFPLTPATPAQNAAVAAAKAYVTKTYPTAKLEMVGPAKEQPGRYRAIFTDHDQRLQLLFDGQGQPVKE